MPAQKNGNIFSFNNLNLIQKEKSFVLSDWNSKNSTIFKVAALTEPLHLLVNVSNSWIKIFQNGKLTDQVDSSSWNLNSNVQLAKVVVGSGAVSSFEITNPGSGWVAGNKGYFDTSRIAGNGVAILDGSVSGAGLTAGNIGVSTDLVLQFTGIGVTSDSYFRLKAVSYTHLTLPTT